MKMTKHLIVRITEDQFKRLADALIIEQKNKSLLMRDILNDYLNGINSKTDKQNNKKTYK